jgi:acyl carrier protein
MNQSQTQAPTKDVISQWLVQWIAKELGLPAAEIETDKSLLNYSLSSVTAMMLVGDLEEWLSLTLPPTLVWDYPSIAAIADFLAEQVGTPVAGAALGNGELRSSGNHSAPAGTGTESMLPLDGMSDQEVTALLNQLIADERAGASL